MTTILDFTSSFVITRNIDLRNNFRMLYFSLFVCAFASVSKRARRNELADLISRSLTTFDVATVDEPLLSPMERFNLTWNYLTESDPEFRQVSNELVSLTSPRDVSPFFREMMRFNASEFRKFGVGSVIEYILGISSVNTTFFTEVFRSVLYRVKAHCMFNHLPNSLRLHPPFHSHGNFNDSAFQKSGALVDRIKQNVRLGDGVFFDQTVPPLPLFGTYEHVIPGKLLYSSGYFSNSFFIEYEAGCIVSNDLPHLQLLPSLRVAAHANKDSNEVHLVLANAKQSIILFSEKRHWKVTSIALKADASGTGFWIAVVLRLILTGGSRRSRILAYHSSALKTAAFDRDFFNQGMTVTFKGDCLLYSGPEYKVSIDLETLQRSTPETASLMDYYLPRRSDFYISWNSLKVSSRSHFYSEPVLEILTGLNFTHFRVILDGDFISCVGEDLSFRVKLTKYRMKRTMSRLCAKRKFRDAVRRPCSLRASWEEIVEFLGNEEMSDLEMVERFWDAVVPRRVQLMTPEEGALLLPRFSVDPATLADCVEDGMRNTCRRIIAEFIQAQDATLLDFEDVDNENLLMRAFYLISNQSRNF